MPANLLTHYPIGALQTVSGNTPYTVSNPEKAAQTFLTGVPVQSNAGYTQKWDGVTYNAGLLGVSAIPASNLATNGAGAPGPFGQIGGTQSIQSWGSVPNEPGAVNLSIGAPFTDGRTLLYSSSNDTIFEAQTDNSTGAVAADYTPTQGNIYGYFGLTFDANGFAYVDLGKVTAGTNTCVQIIRVNPVDGFVPNARVQFVFTQAAIQANI